MLKSDLSKEFNRLETGLIEAKGLKWCGNDAPVLVYPEKVFLLGPNETEQIDHPTKSAGIKIFTEIDCLRIISSETTYILERVQNSLSKTFKIASTTPSAKLLNA